MKFVITGSTNLKVFSKSIFSLSKIGDEIYIEPLQNTFSLRTVNSARSAFVCYTFNKTFFSHFDASLKKHLNDTVSNTNDNDVELAEQFKCKIPSKCLFTIFKSAYSIEKNVEKCTITVKYMPIDKEDQYKVYDYDASMLKKIKNKNNEDELYETKFVIMLTCKGGIKKTYIMNISDCESLQAAFTTNNCPNHLNIHAKCLNEAMHSFQNDVEEVTLVMESEQLTVKNYVEYENAKSLVNTQVVFDKNEFEFYEIERENDLTFCLKEFKICLGFGLLFDLSLDLYYERKGRPVILLYNVNDCFEVNFTLATLSEEMSTQMTRQNITQSQLQQNESLMIANESSLDQTHSHSNQSKRSTNTTNTTVNDTRASATLPIIAATAVSSNRVNSQLQTTVRFEEPPTIPKSNKRTLHDSSNNRLHLDDSNSNSNSTAVFDTKKLAEENNSIIRSTSCSSINQDSTLPPAKKMRSLMESLFDDGSDDEHDENNDETLENFENKNPLKNLEVNKNASTIYIGETSSEDDED